MVYLGLGTNLGDREANLRNAIAKLREEGIEVLRGSSVFETEPQDVLGQPFFFNMVLECATRLYPLQLIRKLMLIEKTLGRDRTKGSIRRGPRLIDIDVLLFNQAVVQTPQLTVPHPRMLDRRFVLEPLLELAPELRDPRTQQPLRNNLAGVLHQKAGKLSLDLL